MCIAWRPAARRRHAAHCRNRPRRHAAVLGSPEPARDGEAVVRPRRRRQFRHLLDQAVRRALTGQDVVSLSGGIDSPPIATFAAREYVRRWGRPIPALSAVYPSFPESDESHYIELVAADLELPLHTYEPGPQRLERLQYWVELFDSPWSTWSPEGTAERCLHAQRLGIRTILSGEFAEQASAIRAYLVDAPVVEGTVRCGGGPAPVAAGGATRPPPPRERGPRRVHAAHPASASLSSSAESNSYRRGSTFGGSPNGTAAPRVRRGSVGRPPSCRSSAPTRPGRLTSTRMRSSAFGRGDPGQTSISGSSSSASPARRSSPTTE